MTDLPELQHLLIEAAGRRSVRRRRVRGMRAVALVAAAVVAVIAVPHVATDDDVEIPAVTPTPTATVAAATTIPGQYGVFLRPTRPEDVVKLLGDARGADTRLVARSSTTDLFLGVKGDQGCVVVAPIEKPATFESCGPAKDFLAGYLLQGAAGSSPTPSAVIVPDGVREVTVTLENGDRHAYPVTVNGVVLDHLAAPAAYAEWDAGDGSRRRVGFESERFDDLYRALRAPGAGLPGFPGSRKVLGANATSVWLVPRKGAICLVVQIKNRQASGCMVRRLDAINGPLVVSMPGGVGGRVVVAATSDRLPIITLRSRAGIDQSSYTGGVLLWSDGGERRVLDFGVHSGRRLSLNVPAGTGGFVLGGVAKDPNSFPDP
jgi:hypothetical protein